MSHQFVLCDCEYCTEVFDQLRKQIAGLQQEKLTLQNEVKVLSEPTCVDEFEINKTDIHTFRRLQNAFIVYARSADAERNKLLQEIQDLKTSLADQKSSYNSLIVERNEILHENLDIRKELAASAGKLALLDTGSEKVMAQQEEQLTTLHRSHMRLKQRYFRLSKWVRAGIVEGHLEAISWNERKGE